ncbi:MAG: M23 family metallopeptidase [Actinobacteria bacterium]|nr:M23 family metallopeptidase [Actinomycetota bacterium]MBU1492363.1 M23 family metallopeptidase [Actinomycetota bacterium]MBU1866804.1 M23 family metallopeptidase [Actinomycetota bacterium]
MPREAWQVDGRAYYFPIQPPEVAAYSGSHHDYPATDIFAPSGSTVVAVTNGVVDELRRDDPWDPAADDPAERGGRFVSIIGDDEVRYYCSHLESVAEGLSEGDRVVAGQVLGAIGNSGNAATTSPHCHFGISRPTGPGDWEVRRGEVGPYDYLQAWTRGEDLTPVLPEG